MLTSSLSGCFGNDDSTSTPSSETSNVVPIVWGENVFMPRAEECVDANNGQEAGYETFAVGYEPSLAITDDGSMFITAHKDLRWGGRTNPFAPLLGGDLGPWYACSLGDETTWDYWASWFWTSTDNGVSWSHADGFDSTPGNSFGANYAAGGSECLGDEGDIGVDAENTVYYLDTTLEDNWWHVLNDNGSSLRDSPCTRTNTVAGDDRPWVTAQADGIVHYLGNSGASPPECSGDVGRYWYYHSENGGNSFSQCYAMPGGWTTIAAQKTGPYVFVAQEDADTASGFVQIRISDNYGRGTGPLPSDGSWQDPINLGPRNGNCPEGYPVVAANNFGTVAVVWSNCPSGGTSAWQTMFTISYDNGSTWEEAWNITPFERGLALYPFIAISESNVVSIAFYGLDLDQGGSTDGYTAGKKWFLYGGALQTPMQNDTFSFTRADPLPLHTVTDAEATSGDTHPLHDFFETVISPDGSWMGIAYQVNIGQHPFEEGEEQRYIKFVSGVFEF